MVVVNSNGSTELSRGSHDTPPASVRAALGGVMLLAGLVVLTDVAFASVVTPGFIGAASILVGIFEIFHALWARRWGALSWQALLGFLYIALGLMLTNVVGSRAMEILTSVVARSLRTQELLQSYMIGLLFIFSGIVRILVSIKHWLEAGWTMMLSGAFGAGVGLVILADFPWMGLWILAILLGIDFLVHGIAWLRFSYFPRPGSAPNEPAPPSA